MVVGVGNYFVLLIMVVYSILEIVSNIYTPQAENNDMLRGCMGALA